MPKAIPRPTTSRRALFTGAAAGVFSAALATAATGADATSGADAELLAACATWHRLTAELMAATEDEDVEAAGERQDAQLRHISLMPARTPEGIRAKASVSVRTLTDQVSGFGSMPWQEEATPPEAFAIRVLAEVAGTPLEGLAT